MPPTRYRQRCIWPIAGDARSAARGRAPEDQVVRSTYCRGHQAFGTRPEGHQCHPPCDMLVVCHRLSRCTILGQLTERPPRHLLVRNGMGSVDVYLCTKSFFDDMGMDFSKGDGITLTRLESETGRSGI